MKNLLSFEKPIAELQQRINDLEKESLEKNIDLASSIELLKEELKSELQTIFSNLNRWEKVMVARHPERPHLIDYVKALIPDYLYFCGDRLFREDPAIFGAMGHIDENNIIMLIGHHKGKNTKENIACNFGMANPEGYRKALRLMRLAEKFRVPIVCLIDTSGAYPGIEAEEHGQSEAIAVNLREMFSLRVPILAMVTGEGGSGGALGIGVGDRILMLEHSIYSVISPEGCASILWRDASKASLAAEKLKLTAQDLWAHHLIDGIIPEPVGGAHRDHREMISQVKDHIQAWLSGLRTSSWDEDLLQKRYEKFSYLASYQQVKNNLESSLPEQVK
ncbi:MAG TPA: acetyl-CoA carboxylase carboxyltransferase subunit alpha [Caldisericia bacterium]|nr:acetyl-CoA carboxylase carboxyltransferase subunit alpha [Caldisericia bacterium]